jgi:hypothetical protein
LNNWVSNIRIKHRFSTFVLGIGLIFENGNTAGKFGTNLAEVIDPMSFDQNKNALLTLSYL